MVKAIVGANWGDEGKGKITDMLAESSDVVIRFQGGANAGHTIINDRGRFALHTLPSGAFYPHVTNIIGNGVALDIRKLVDELRSITDQGVPAPNLIISERAQLLMPYHTLQDAYEEERLGGKAFGSTKSGIAPFYSDKYAKIGIQVCDLFHEDRLMERLTAALAIKNVLFQHLYHKPALDAQELFQQLLAFGRGPVEACLDDFGIEAGPGHQVDLLFKRHVAGDGQFPARRQGSAFVEVGHAAAVAVQAGGPAAGRAAVAVGAGQGDGQLFRSPDFEGKRKIRGRTVAFEQGTAGTVWHGHANSRKRGGQGRPPYSEARVSGRQRACNQLSGRGRGRRSLASDSRDVRRMAL